jgi:hypothetical protein
MGGRLKTSKIIDEIIDNTPKGYLCDIGFRKTTWTFHQTSGSLIKTINFQASWLNKPDKAEFTVNLGITTPFYHEIWSGNEMPKNPGSAASFIHRRIGHLLDTLTDKWWTVRLDMDPIPIGREITSLLQDFGLPFLNKYNDIEGIIDALQTISKPPLTFYNPKMTSAILYGSIGDWNTAHTILCKLKKSNKLETFDETIDLIIDRLEKAKIRWFQKDSG